MNKQQKEILQSQLDSEKAVLDDLRAIYKKSLDDVNDRIAALKGRTDVENLQSIIYQVDYQNALKTQINGILDTLNGEQFETISDYLTKSYEDGFLGVMYDLQGQGIPLAFPIDQTQVVKAIQLETNLSKSLYSSLGEDVEALKKNVASSISRGIAQNSSYADMAKSVAASMVGDYSKMNGGAIGRAMLITRTEGHRAQESAGQDARQKAKDAGADVVKQWDSALDKKTRPHHVQLDGQIRELDEAFEVAGHKGMYPGGFGVPEEDINCRCTTLQRAKLALDDEELEELKKRAEYFELDKTEDFEKFKQKYNEYVESQKPKITKPFEGKTYSLNPDGTLSEFVDNNLDSYELDITSDKIITSSEAAKLPVEKLQDYEAIIDGKNITLTHPENYKPTKIGQKWDEYTYTMNPDGTFSVGVEKHQAQFKIDVKNNKVLNIDVTQYVDDYPETFQYPNASTAAMLESLPPDMYDELEKIYDLNPDIDDSELLKSLLQKNGYDAVHAINTNTATQDLLKDFVQVFDDDLVTKTKKSKLETLTSSLATQQKKLSKVDNKTYSGIWYNQDVSVSDYPAYKGKIQVKKEWYSEQLASGKLDEATKIKFQHHLDELDEFEKLGSEYEAISLKIKKIESDIKKFTPAAKITDAGDAFSQERKDAAKWFTDKNGGARAADEVYRDKSGEVWRESTTAEKEAIYEYTRSYSKFNEPLRGIEYGTNKFLGVGNVNLEQIGVSYGGFAPGEVKKEIDAMTDIIEKSSYDFDIWTQRGTRRSGMDKFFGIDMSDFDLPEKELSDKLLGTTPTEHAFMSTADAKGHGLNVGGGNIVLNVYAPSGTKMMYVEPFSAFGNGDGRSWNGISKQTSFGSEAEIILQRETHFRVTKVEKRYDGTIFVDLEVIGQG